VKIVEIFLAGKQPEKQSRMQKVVRALSGSVSTRIFFAISMMLGWLGLAGLTL